MPTPNPPVTASVRPYGKGVIDHASRLILEGACVAVATETVYGLAADATNGAAVAGIYAAKGRPAFNPLIVHVPDVAAAREMAVFDDVAEKLAVAFWPGPLTLVLERRAECPVASLATAGLATIALRVPAHPAMQALLLACGKPLAAPSANASGTISPTRAEHVSKTLGGRIPLIIDSGPTTMGLESTIIAVRKGGAVMLRPGPILPEDILAVAGLAALGSSDGSFIEAPGQLASHYAPTKPLRLNATSAAPGEWLIGFGGIVGDTTLSSTGDLNEAAARLFDCLHQADQ
jgi:L-threonylcarbamoyladenylate synthase